MPDDPKELKAEDLHALIQELRTDVLVTQLVLQNMLANMIKTIPEKKEAVLHLQSQIRGLIFSMKQKSSDSIAYEQERHLILAGSDRFFEPINELFRLNAVNPSDRPN